MLLLARLDSAKSISRYTPPNGTAGFARSAVSGARRVPAPPASTIPRTDGSGMTVPPVAVCCHAAPLTGLMGRPARRVVLASLAADADGRFAEITHRIGA